MRWYLNDASLQGQFVSKQEFEEEIKKLLSVRNSSPILQKNFRVTRSLSQAPVTYDNKLADLVRLFHRDLKLAFLQWVDKVGPFVDDDRLCDEDDYFEYENIDVTDTGLGEATRRVKDRQSCAAFSFRGGGINFAVDPLNVDHGLPGDRLGQYQVQNIWDFAALRECAREHEPINSWPDLFNFARSHFKGLEIGALESNPVLAREPFETSIRDQCLRLLGYLNEYVLTLDEDGSPTEGSQEIVNKFFYGGRASFTAESQTNQNNFRSDLTFKRIDGTNFFGHWHGKVSHRFFRLHFEWPLEGKRRKIEIFYFGPKITKE